MEIGKRLGFSTKLVEKPNPFPSIWLHIETFFERDWGAHVLWALKSTFKQFLFVPSMHCIILVRVRLNQYPWQRINNHFRVSKKLIFSSTLAFKFGSCKEWLQQVLIMKAPEIALSRLFSDSYIHGSFRVFIHYRFSVSCQVFAKNLAHRRYVPFDVNMFCRHCFYQMPGCLKVHVWKSNAYLWSRIEWLHSSSSLYIFVM